MNIFPANVKLGCKSQRIPYFVALKRGGQLLTLPIILKIKAKQFVTGRDIYGHDSIYRKTNLCGIYDHISFIKICVQKQFMYVGYIFLIFLDVTKKG